MRLCFDYGHGGKDVGAVGYGLCESHSVLAIGQKTKAIMEKQGYQIIETRSYDRYVSLNERANISNNNNCDIFISFHLNGFNHEQAHGVETYHFPNSINGKKLATKVQESIINTGLFKADRGVKQEDFAVLRLTHAPAILIESGFITNKHDNSVIRNQKDDIARSIAQGLNDYFGVNPFIPNNDLVIDGYMGVKTITKLQQYLGTPVDGVISSPSPMVKELQRRLNRGVL